MLKLFLCDNDSFFLSLEAEIIEHILEEEHLETEIAGKGTSVFEMLTFLKHNPGCYLVFLALDFGENQPNGLDISNAIKRLSKEIHVVFIASHADKAFDVLKSGTEPFGFLEKGTDMKQLSYSLRHYIHMALHAEQRKKGGGKNTISLKLGCGEMVTMDYSEILYVEAEKGVSHGITYHSLNGSKITIRSTLNEEEKRLDGGFLRVHRSFLVARNQIIRLHKGYLILSNQEQIPCAVRMQAEIKKWL